MRNASFTTYVSTLRRYHYLETNKKQEKTRTSIPPIRKCSTPPGPWAKSEKSGPIRWTPIGKIHSSQNTCRQFHSSQNTYRQYSLTTHLSEVFTPHGTPIGSIHSCCMLHAWTPKGHYGCTVPRLIAIYYIVPLLSRTLLYFLRWTSPCHVLAELWPQCQTHGIRYNLMTSSHTPVSEACD